MSAKVSVMVPVYNAERYIRECLDSLFSQDYEDFEVVVSDDASSDGTQQILQEYADKYSNMILFLNQKNLGITDNCDQIFKACSGDYIALFAGDDVMLPGKLRFQVEYMQQHQDVSMTYHSVEIFNSDNGVIIGVTNLVSSDETNNSADIIKKMGIAGPMSIMARTSAVPKDIYKTKVKYISDWLFQIEASMAGRVVLLPGVWCRYRKYGANNGKDLSRYIHEFEEVINYVKGKYSQNAELVEACEQGLSRFLAGEAFRNIQAGDVKLARINLRRAIQLDKKIIYVVAYIVSFVPFISRFVKGVKYSLKKVLNKLGWL
ncbi:glycosyltransferase [Pseudomonas yamanorum]|uniref:glycosyltransferase n=1 Tax=Pseudomonas yamanorum TaxID=515393 RepID=UPI002ED6992C|nr:glycosyltransferase [Pseudomonas yamanorum]